MCIVVFSKNGFVEGQDTVVTVRPSLAQSSLAAVAMDGLQ
jgi:hypothetical protein